MRRRTSLLPLLAFISCGLIWGTTFLAIRVGNDSLPALWGASLRFFFAGIILNSILFASGGRWPKGEALKAAIWYGVLEFGVSMSLLYLGEKVVPSGLAAVLYAICPVVAMFCAKAMGMEQLSLKRLGAAILAFLGVAVIFWREVLQGGSALGLFYVFVAACAAPIAGLILQRAPKQSAVGANAVASLVGLGVCLPLSFALGEKQVIPTTGKQLYPVLYLAVMGSVGAFVIFAWLVQRWRATTIAFLGVLVPVIAVMVGAVARNEALAPGSLIGAMVVLIGVTVALKSENEPGGRSPLDQVAETSHG